MGNRAGLLEPFVQISLVSPETLHLKRSPLCLKPLVADERFLERLRCEEPNAWDQFVTHFLPRITVKLHSEFKDGEKVQDLCAEVFSRFLKAIRKDQFAGTANLGAILIAICNQICREERAQ